MSADWWANGKQVVTASWDRMIKLWDVDSAKVVHTLEGKTKFSSQTAPHSMQKGDGLVRCGFAVGFIGRTSLSQRHVSSVAGLFLIGSQYMYLYVKLTT